MKVGIFFIGTDRYNEFYNVFKESIKKYFLPLHEKHFFITTDNKEHKIADDETVNFINESGWKNINLKRFEFFLNFDVSLMDYVFFINSNAECKDYIHDEEILPLKIHNGLVSYGKFFSNNILFSSDKESAAYVDDNKIKFCCCGCFQGGETKKFIDLCKSCVKMIENDKSINYKPFSEEIYFNKYAYENGFKRISRKICDYETSYCNKQTKILMRDKQKLINNDWFISIRK